MRYDTSIAIKYDTAEAVPIRDIIETLQGFEAVVGEAAKFLPSLVDGVQVQRLEIKVSEIVQQSPLRELFLVALFLAFQDDLEREVTGNIESVTGTQIPDNWDTIVTVLVLVLIFYGVGAIKEMVVGKATDGPSERKLKGLITELAADTGKSEEAIRGCLDARYGDPTLWKRLANATSRFFAPSKRQNSAPIQVNDRQIDHETVQDVPAQYLIDNEADTKPARTFLNAELELHAQDRDHAGRGWAAIPRGIHEQRLRLRLMDDVSAGDVWGHDNITGDITVVYEKVGLDMVPKEIHLHRVTGFGK